MRQEDITGLLREWSGGNPQAFEKLVPLVYDELRRLAGNVVKREGAGNPVQRTALVHELYLKLVDQERTQWRDREHFFGIAIKMMRRLMVDEARIRCASKRGSGAVHVPVDDALDRPAETSQVMLDIDDALTRFAEIDPERSRIVEMRYFGGFDLEEIAELTGVSRTTIKRQWTVARMWLHRELGSMR